MELRDYNTYDNTNFTKLIVVDILINDDNYAVFIFTCH